MASRTLIPAAALPAALAGLLALAAGARADDADAGAPADLPPPIPVEKLETYLALVEPLPREWRWRDEIPWVGTIHEARERAAREDKPILVWQAADSPCLGST